MDLKKDISILYFGTPEISAFVLNKLIENNYKIVGVVAQEDKPIGRKGLLEHVPTKKVALKYGIPVYQFKKVREHYEEILNIKPDLILTLAFGQIISHDILTIPKYGCLNLHGSILPKYRGAAPIQYSLLNGDAETGISLMEMVDKCDAGKVYAVEKVKIELDDNCTSLTDKLKVAAFDVFDKNIEAYLSNNLPGKEQDEILVSFSKKIKEEDEIINFKDTSKNVINKIRALAMQPGAYFIKNGIKYKIYKAHISCQKGEPSTVIVFNKKELVIGTSDGSISIDILQKEGKKILDYKSFYNGNSFAFEIGDVLNDGRN